jgi:hypothetical protein
MMPEPGSHAAAATRRNKREAPARRIRPRSRSTSTSAIHRPRSKRAQDLPRDDRRRPRGEDDEDELSTLLAWLDSPTNKKYQQVALDAAQRVRAKVLGDMPALLDPKLQALDGSIRVILGVPRPAPRRRRPGRPPPASK